MTNKILRASLPGATRKSNVGSGEYEQGELTSRQGKDTERGEWNEGTCRGLVERKEERNTEISLPWTS